MVGQQLLVGLRRAWRVACDTEPVGEAPAGAQGVRMVRSQGSKLGVDEGLERRSRSGGVTGSLVAVSDPVPEFQDDVVVRAKGYQSVGEEPFRYVRRVGRVGRVVGMHLPEGDQLADVHDVRVAGAVILRLIVDEVAEDLLQKRRRSGRISRHAVPMGVGDPGTQDDGMLGPQNTLHVGQESFQVACDGFGRCARCALRVGQLSRVVKVTG